MQFAEVLTSETILSVLALFIGGIWTIIKASDWYRHMRTRRLDRVLEALEAAVETVYRDYVRDIKAAHPDGSLTAQEQQQARTLARDRAADIARKDGLDLSRELGADYIDLWTSRLVKKLKSA